MKVSNALPVQLYVNGVASFNNKKEAGIDKGCFYQLFNDSDTINFVIEDAESDKYSLKIFDENSILLELIDLVKVGDIFSLSFSTSDYSSIIGKYIKFSLGNYVDTAVESNEFTTDLEDWIFQFGGGSLADWAWSAANGGSMETTTLNTYGVKNYHRPLTLPQEASKIRVTYNPIVAANSSDLKIQFTLQNGTNIGDNIIQIIDEPLSSSGIITYNVTTQSYWEDTTWIKVVIASTGFVAGDVIDFMKFEILSPVFTEVAYSDLINLSSAHRNTRQIKYTNDLPFANIPYDDGDPEFSIRVLSKFYKPRIQQEDESEPDGSGDVVKLSGTVKNQKLLEMEMLPPYMLEKLALIFKHNSIWVENESYVAEEPLEIDDLDDRSPFFNAKIWLTRSEENYVTNV